jgi:ribosomal protein S18 acetylase RimI-like enzyme
MSLPSDLRLRDATLDDLPAVAALRVSVGWAVAEWALRAVIEQPHARCLVAVEGDGALAGVGSGIVYGRLGFIGNMIVAAAHRRRGVGSAILDAVAEYLEGAGCTRLELNATSDGRPLYERHGFRSLGRSATARIPRDAHLAPDPTIAVRGATSADMRAITGYDLPRFGGDRRILLEILVEAPGTTTLLATVGGVMAGYACVRTSEGRVGPMLAETPSVAATLLREAFALVPDAPEYRLNLPPNNRPGAAWLEELGVDVEPWDGRMGRGPEIRRRDETIYGMAIGALG